MHVYILLLSDLSYQAVLIGLAEYQEHRAVADRLSASGFSLPDPRKPAGEERDAPSNGIRPAGKALSGPGEDPDDKDHCPRFLAFNKWMFTLGDTDCYPSVPHGHLQNKTPQWPKLNPYTGRAFKSQHQEDVGSRLSKTEMSMLWNDPAFVEHCRQQILWHSKYAPSYSFPNARFGRDTLPRWHRR
jgi:hypothetical protein